MNGIRIAVWGLVAIAVLAVLYVAQPVLLPLAAAFLLSFVLRPISRALGRLGSPAPLSALLLVALLGGGVVYGIYRLGEPAEQWLNEAPRSLQQLQYRLRSLKKSITRVQSATEEVSRLGKGGEEASKEVVVEDSNLDSQLLIKTQEVAVGLFTTLVLLFFILGWGDRLYRNVVNALPHFREQRRAVLIAHDVESAITVYLGTITLINIVLGVVVGGLMYLMGMPNPVLWGVMAGVNNYVPYLGPAITAAVLAFVALLSYPSVAEALLVPGAFLIITSLEGYIITPMAVGRRLTLNPLLIMLSLLFWFWMWG
ncbi:MAG: AI-2E family transporter, partial [Gammaproteobacteria bacterium]